MHTKGKLLLPLRVFALLCGTLRAVVQIWEYRAYALLVWGDHIWALHTLEAHKMGVAEQLH